MICCHWDCCGASSLRLIATSLMVFARAPLHGRFLADVLPGMLLFGIGSGMTATPFLFAALNDVSSKDSGLASGILNTSAMMGGALGLACLARVAEMRTRHLLETGADGIIALNGGYHGGFFVGAFLTVIAATLAVTGLRSHSQKAAIGPENVAG